MAWEKVKLGDVCKIGDGAHASLKRLSHGIPYLTAKNLTRNGIDVQNLDFIDETTYNKHFKESSIALTRPQKDDILYSIIGSIGGVYLVKDEKIGISSSVAIFRSNPSTLISKYLYYYLKSSLFDSQIQAIKGGVAQGFMSLSKLSSIEISYPLEIKTQQKIADILSAYDNLIENNQKQIKLLEEAAQRLYKQWFIDLKFPGHETTKIVDGLPKGWKKEKLVDFADVVMGQSPKSEFYNQEKKGLPFHQGVGSYGTRFVKDDIYSSSVTRIAEAGSILFSVRAPVGRLNFTKNKVIIGRGLAAINHKAKCQSFLFYMLKDRFFKDDILGNGAIFASISKDELLNQKFVIPSRELMSKFNTIASAIDDKISTADAQIQHLTQSRNRLLPKLMNGMMCF